MSDPDVVFITLDEWIHLSAEVLGVDAATVRSSANLHLADSALHAPAAGLGDMDAYPDLIDKAAVLGWHLANNHPLPDGNKRCAFVAMVVFLKRNRVVWATPSIDDTVATMIAVAAKDLNVADFAAWVRAQLL